jgi:hypothetical protein
MSLSVNTCTNEMRKLEFPDAAGNILATRRSLLFLIQSAVLTFLRFSPRRCADGSGEQAVVGLPWRLQEPVAGR